jgi:hypothetical protein
MECSGALGLEREPLALDRLASSVGPIEVHQCRLHSDAAPRRKPVRGADRSPASAGALAEARGRM